MLEGMNNSMSESTSVRIAPPTRSSGAVRPEGPDLSFAIDQGEEEEDV